jgi:regulator of protease activity HflC (stomatin/prohibitin superfamily)
MNNLRQIVIAGAIVLGIIVLIAANPLFIVRPGQVGVSENILTGKTKSRNPGTHLLVPFLYRTHRFDVRTQRLDVQANSASKDLQHVSMDVALNYILEHKKVNQLFAEVGMSYQEKVIDPAVQESVKAASSQFPVEEIIVQRQALKTMMEEHLRERLAKYYITLENLNLIDIRFTEEFNRVIEQKQVEEQKIKTAEYQKRQAQQYKEKAILEAQAESEKQRLLRQTVTPDIVALEWIKKWDGKLPETMLGDSKALLMLPGKDKQ